MDWRAKPYPDLKLRRRLRETTAADVKIYPLPAPPKGKDGQVPEPVSLPVTQIIIPPIVP